MQFQLYSTYGTPCPLPLGPFCYALVPDMEITQDFAGLQCCCGLCSYHIWPLSRLQLFAQFPKQHFCYHNISPQLVIALGKSRTFLQNMGNVFVHSVIDASQRRHYLIPKVDPLICGQSLVLYYQYGALSVPFFSQPHHCSSTTPVWLQGVDCVVPYHVILLDVLFVILACFFPFLCFQQYLIPN